MASEVGWFVDGAYLFKCWLGLNTGDQLDYLKLRQLLESTYCDAAAAERIIEAYYFNADPDPPTAKQNAFHNALAYPPPTGPGLRVKLYWVQRKPLFWPAGWAVAPSCTQPRASSMRSRNRRRSTSGWPSTS